MPSVVLIRNWLQGSLFCCLWYASICSGFLLLYCPLLPLLLFNQRLFRRATDAIFAAWEMYPVAMLECFLGTRIVVTGDKILPQDRAILVMNHRTRLDWNFLWAAMFHASQPLAHRLKFVLKAPIRHVPGPGWVMQMNCFLYIHRRWERDKALLARAMDYLADINYTYQVLLFPEGTDLTPKSQQRSNEFAATHHLERYHQVLHPKTTGFVFLAQRMRQNGSLDAVYDLSIGYPCNVPQSELDLIQGNFPKEVHFHITRHSSCTLPREDAKLRDWLADVWRQKEAALTDFYAGGSFLSPTPPSHYTPQLTSSAIPSPDYSDLVTPTTPRVQHLDRDHLDRDQLDRDRLDRDRLDRDRLDRDRLDRDHSDRDQLDRPVSTDNGDRYHSSALHLAIMFWTALSALALYAVLFSTWARYYAAAHCVLFLGLSCFSEGIHHVEISLHEMKKCWIPCYRGDGKRE